MPDKTPTSGQIWGNPDRSGRVKILKVNPNGFSVRNPDGKTSNLKTLGKRVYIKG